MNVQLEFDPRTNLRQIFPTLLGRFQLPDAGKLAPRIAEVVQEKRKQDGGVQKSNMGGWHSDATLMQWPELEFADLADTFRSAVSHMTVATSGITRFRLSLQLTAWANINGPGAFNSSHIHPGNHWSGVLYVQVPDFSSDPIRQAGQIEFTDPRGPINMLQSPGQVSVFSHSPATGEILVFPSWLYHNVLPYSIDAERISIAFNARIEQFEKA
jgi:uncharacterized protein (TIGR02466 family)